MRDEKVQEAIQRIGRLMYERSTAFADEFVEDGLLIGSELGEIARGRDAIGQLMASFHALPSRYTWAWDTIDTRVEGETAWFFTEGFSVAELGGEQTRRPYRLAGVLERENGQWRWQLFSGSEPKFGKASEDQRRSPFSPSV